MKSHGGVKFLTLSALAVAAALTQTGAPAFAADPVKLSNTVSEQVTVVAPRVVRERVHGLPDERGGMGYYDLLTLTDQVGYSDLNLARPADARTLENRIGEAANQICERLADVRPAERKSRECVHDAIEGAMDEAQAAIAAAEK